MNAENPESSETSFDFAGKYEEGGGIAAGLVNGFYRALASLCSGIAPQSVLEVGCGEGFGTQRIHEMLPPDTVFRALDVETRLVEATARRNPDVPVTLGSIYALPEQDRSLDLVLALEVLEHLEDPVRALSELQRISRRWVVTSVPREPLWRFLNLCRLRYVTDLGNTPGHLQHWSSRSFVRLISQFGEVLAVRRPLPWTIVLWKPHRGSVQAAKTS
jgi:ubiquinone/menaquinone biosynthesis C-methylase UbiE